MSYIVVLQLQALIVLDIRSTVARPPSSESGLYLVVQRSPSVGF